MSSAHQLSLVLLQMASRDLFAQRVEPPHLTQPRPCRPEVAEIDGAGLVVVGEVADLASVGRSLDDGEGGIG